MVRVLSVLTCLSAAALLNACGAIDADWLWTGVRAKDKADIRAALNSVTSSPITWWSQPAADHPEIVNFSTKDGKHYSAEKIRGKWHIEEATIVGVASSNDLTRRCSFYLL